MGEFGEVLDGGGEGYAIINLPCGCGMGWGMGWGIVVGVSWGSV